MSKLKAIVLLCLGLPTCRVRPEVSASFLESLGEKSLKTQVEELLGCILAVSPFSSLPLCSQLTFIHGMGREAWYAQHSFFSYQKESHISPVGKCGRIQPVSSSPDWSGSQLGPTPLISGSQPQHLNMPSQQRFPCPQAEVC